MTDRWFTAFRREPGQAVADLISGRAGVGSGLRLDVPELLYQTFPQNLADERAQLDMALLSWLLRMRKEAVGFDDVALHVEYVLAAQPEERQAAFAAALRRNVPGRGGEVMNYVERMVERGRREGMSNVERMVEQSRQEGEMRGRLQTIQEFLGRDVPWSTIEAATGIDEDTFRRLEREFDDNGAGNAD